MQADGRKGQRQCPGCQHTSFGALHQFIDIAMTAVEIAGGVNDANHRFVERRVTIAQPLDKGFAQKQCKFIITIAGKPPPHSLFYLIH